MKFKKRMILGITLAMGLGSVVPTYAMDFTAYDFQGKELLSESAVKRTTELLEQFPDYMLINYLNHGGKITFKNGAVAEESAIGRYWWDSKKIYIRADLYNVYPEYQNFDDEYAWTILHEIGHFYYRNYLYRLDNSTKEMLKDNNSFYRDVYDSCYNDDETFAEIFSLYYMTRNSEYTPRFYPYDKLEEIVKTEMEIN